MAASRDSPPGAAGAPGAAGWLARHDRAVVLTAAGVIVLLSGLYTLGGGGVGMSALEMTRMASPAGGASALQPPGWTPSYAVLVFLMWWVMMIAMMTPSAAPVLLLFAAVKRAGPEAARAAPLSLLFLSGYLLAWAGFSAAATGLQWLLETAGLSKGPMMPLSDRALAGAVLLAAGAYQFTPTKRACLAHCRSPVDFLTAHRRQGPAGAALVGAHHGTYCLGCCWVLMVLLFAGGVMNLYWIAGLALYVLAEKHLPNGEVLARIAGAGLIAAGAWMLATGL
ncbi:DUF2182 domain-containing protein [Cribrihabitans neustonicus]|uniref:DUF2182 domain-containing protein n=1 Tax=Cribrihabitans neustonicus TaxID=1429085 RepID=UPI003B5BDB2A